MRKQVKTDRRIQRTQTQLQGALAALVREKNYDDIVVKEILDRANIGRSTFYTHYRGKDALLRGGIDAMLASRSPGDRETAGQRVIRLSLPVFEHVGTHRQAGHAAIGPQSRRRMHDRLRLVIAELVQDVVRAEMRHRGAAPFTDPRLLAHWVASTAVLVLDWWVECDAALTAQEAHDVFRRLVEPALGSALSEGATSPARR